MKKVLSLMLCVLTVAALLAGCGSTETEVKYPVATITTAGGDTIKLELYPEKAPNTVANFIYLVNEGFYNGTTFHFVAEDGSYVQAGDPDNNRDGGPGYTIQGEFERNGIENTLSHEAGVVSMARRESGYDTAGSQFFILTEDLPALDGSYAAFGRVIEGMDIVEAISRLETDEYGRPRDTITIKKVTVDTFGVDYGQPEVIKD